jgi:uncharacterized protein
MNATHTPSRLRVTAEAVNLLHRLSDQHGALMIHQSGGCCHGSAAMCYPQDRFIVGDRDVLLASSISALHR